MNLSLVLRGIISLIVVIGITGCGAKREQFSGFKVPKKGNGMVYIYRPSSFVGGAVYYNIRYKNNNDEVIGTLRNGTFISKEMTPGKKTLWAKIKDTSTVIIDVKANEIVCVEGGTRFGVTAAKPDLRNVDNATCAIKINNTQKGTN